MLLVLALVPMALGTYQQSILTKVVIFALFAISLDLTMGYAGLVSFGHAAFLGVAGYTVLALVVKLGITSFWMASAIALAVTVVTALAFGYISLRVSGIYYLLVTMGLGQVFFVIATKWTKVTNGIDGLTWTERPDLGFDIQWTNLKYYYMVLVFFILCYVTPAVHSQLLLRQDIGGGTHQRAADEEPGLQHLATEVCGRGSGRHLRRRGRAYSSRTKVAA